MKATWARLEEVKGVCLQRDCRRRCEIDVQRLASRGFGALPMEAVQRLMRCQRLEGCGLDFHRDRRTSLPLRALVGRAHVRVRIQCSSCRFHRAPSPESVIQKLAAETPPGDDVLISEVAGRVRGPCKQCGKSAWRVDVLWPDDRSEGWRRSVLGRDDH